MKVKVISLPYVFQVLYVLCFTEPRYQVSVYRTIGPLVHFSIRNIIERLRLKRYNFVQVTLRTTIVSLRCQVTLSCPLYCVLQRPDVCRNPVKISMTKAVFDDLLISLPYVASSLT